MAILVVIVVIVVVGALYYVLYANKDTNQAKVNTPIPSSTNKTSSSTGHKLSSEDTLAVLQRNARNNKRENDVSTLLADVEAYMNNHTGNVPMSSGLFADKFQGASPDLTFYNLSKVFWQYNKKPTSAAVQAGADVILTNYAGCNSSGTGLTTNLNTTSSRSVAAVFTIEGKSGVNQPQCVEG